MWSRRPSSRLPDVRNVTLALVVLALGCDVSRDLDAGRFACDAGGTCDAGEVRDGGAHLEDGGATPSCDEGFGVAAACGGDPNGTWTVVEGCGDGLVRALAAAVMCPGLAFSTLDVSDWAGSLQFNAAAERYSSNLSYAISASVFVPALCTTTIGLSCADAALAFSINVAPTTCADAAGGGCDCQLSGRGTLVDAGDFTLDAIQIDFDSDQLGRLHAPYCADAQSLVLSLAGTTLVTRP